MSNRTGLSHVVVDGSNLATEGRSMPSLAQLSEAVGGFMDEHPDVAITVVVDATFGHRIDKKEVAEFEAGISNNELVAPPAGAVGRGDAFVLGIADKAGASVLSNDSFQEFHGEYTWLFDEGRLIGGKPVPHVGWVWVDRVPVRGPISRKATRGSGASRRSGSSSGGRARRGAKRDDESTVRTGSKEASSPMPTPKSPPPGLAAAPKQARAQEPAAKKAPKGGEPVNELMPFLNFVEQHPAGTSVNGTVDAYSSHGAYITVGDSGVRAYVPLRLMADPMPRSAKSIMKVGESVTVVVVSFAPARRSIDCAVPDMADAAIAEAAHDDADVDDDDLTSAPKDAASRKTPAKKTPAKKTVVKKVAAKKAAAKKTVAKKSAAKKTSATKTSAKKFAAKKAAAKKTVAKKTVAKKTPAKTVAKKVAEKKAVSKKTAAKKTAAKKTAAKKTAAKKAPAKKAAAKKAVSKKTAVSAT
ncbi:MAG: histone H1-like repetitive region-containing protein [Ilumatobacter sp.]